MKIAGVQDSVTVTGDAPVVDPGHTAVSSVVGRQQIESLPINGRNFISFSVITPGVTTDRTPQQGATATSGLSFARSARPLQQHHGRRPRQQRPRRRLGARDVQPGGDPGIPGPHEFVLGRVRQRLGRRREHRDQERHQRSSTATAFAYFRDETLNAKDHFEKFDRFGNPHRSEEGAVRPGAMGRRRSAVPCGRTRRSSSCPSSRRASKPTTSSTSTRTRRPCWERTAFRSSWQRAVRLRTTDVLGKLDHQFSPTSTFVRAGQLRRHDQREHRAVRRPRRPQPRGRAASEGLVALGLADRLCSPGGG